MDERSDAMEFSNVLSWNWDRDDVCGDLGGKIEASL